MQTHTCIGGTGEDIALELSRTLGAYKEVSEGIVGKGIVQHLRLGTPLSDAMVNPW